MAKSEIRFKRRIRCDRGGHELYEYFKPLDHDRGRTSGKKGRRKRFKAKAVCKDEPCSRVEGRNGISERFRIIGVSGSIGVPPCGLWMHDVHRQQRTAARAN